ncbi:ElyC/SanA/YdcF family protein [Leptolyngbya sp. FACHB-711]|uniref:YdcF family protein n=1 Tax=unclassified Leptolyngbya TaxID=2650499 RepID=UPI00168636BC|nr:ElyC/SanA/YdcF family protein [Leptolyngbya sp. FACHB-711]MBD1851608.1 YdcF family protein [Cyanobacteria bacterium FACHB-502]MBD2025362.1 YdcF family protein [Leptolyngbya sp. FACHB-711]
MFELITQLLLLTAIFFIVRYVLQNFIDRRYLTWLGGIVLVLLLVLAFLQPTNRTVGILWSFIAFFLRPLGLSLVLLGAAMRKGLKSVDGGQVLAAFLILLIFSLPLTAYLLTAQTEQRTVLEAVQRQEASNPQEGQAIVVLGDGALPSDPSSRIRTQISNTTGGLSVNLQSRLLYAAQLYGTRVARGNTPLVIVSSIDGNNEAVNSDQSIRALLTANGVPNDRIQIDRNGVDPRSSAEAARNILTTTAGNGNCRLFAVCDNNASPVPAPATAGRVPIVLVAPTLSIRRTASTFTRLNFSVIPRPTDFYVFQIQRGLQFAAVTDIIPSAEALVITTRVVDEYLATIYYFLRGWLADPLTV